MLCFEIRLNGEIVALAGTEEGVLSTILSSLSEPSSASPQLSLEIGAFANGTHLSWPQPSVHSGDRIEILITEAEHPHPPAHERRESDEFREQAERRYYERLKRKYDP